MIKNKTILQIVPALNTGGVERGVLEISKYLVKNDNKSIVITSGGLFEHHVKRHGGILYKLDVHLKNPFKWKSIRLEIESIISKEKIDLVHVSSRIPAWIILPVIKKLKIPFITSVHTRLRRQNVFKNYYNSILIQGDLIIAISKHVKENIIRMFPKVKNKVHIVYRGVDIDNFNLNNISNSRIVNQSKLLGIQDEKPTIIMASRPKMWKGHLILIEALKKIEIDFQCFLIGANDGNYRFKKKLYDKINNYKLGHKVKLTSSTNDIQAAFILGDVIVMPSIAPEPFGRIIIEAQSLEKIVIGFNHGGISESIKDQNTGFLAVPLDANDLCKKITQALTLKTSERKKIVANAKKIVREKFSLEKMCIDTLNLYKNCIDGHLLK